MRGFVFGIRFPRDSRHRHLMLTLLLVLSVPSAQSASPEAPSAATAVAPDVVFTLIGPDGQAIVRAITPAAECPSITWDGQRVESLRLRADAQTLPPRPDAAQEARKPVTFPVRSCEIAWPLGVHRAHMGERDIPAPRSTIQRILVLGDTGCRLKGSEQAFQDCLDSSAWPFAKISQTAAQLRPDLVVHLGDIHYRESPCPATQVGCAGVSWGYGWDAWRDDFFQPAAPLLAAAPWVFVRGNHESCFRAGQAWMRFMDPWPWSDRRSCNLPTNDIEADFSTPFAVPLSEQSQLLIFDSSKASGKAYEPQDPAATMYLLQLHMVSQLAKNKNQNFFLSHHPLLAVVSDRNTRAARTSGTKGLQSAFALIEPQRLLPDSIGFSLHGHLHLFESLSFESEHPASLIMGNSGSMMEAKPPSTLAADFQVYPGTTVNAYTSHSDFGFALLERQQENSSSGWKLTEFSPDGQPLLNCILAGNSSICSK